MPTYRITGPNGKVYEVNAPKGTTQAQALARVKAQAPATAKAKQTAPATKAPRSGWQTAGDFLGDTIDNVLPNWGDEIAAIPDAAKALVKGQPVGEAFDRGQADFKANQAQYDEEHPNLAWASTIAGTGASLALPAGNLVRAASLGAKVLQAAKIGGLYGAVSGAGEGEGLIERGTNAIKSGAIGAGFGAGLARATPAAVKGARYLRQNVPGVDGALRQLGKVPRAIFQRPQVQQGQRAIEQADRMLAARMEQGHIQEGMGQLGDAATPNVIAHEQERRQAMGVPAIPGDVTEPMRNLTSWASRGMGPGQARVIAKLDGRKAQEASRVRQHVIDTMGDVGDPLLQVEQKAAAAKAAAGPGYKEAYAQPMVLTPEIEAIMQTPAFREALPQAATNIRNDMRDPEALGFRMAKDGTIDPQLHKTLSVEGFDQVIRAMKDSGRAAMDTNGIRPVNTTNSVHINNRASDLRSQLGDQNPAYGDVTARYADDMAQRAAFVSGQDVAGLTGHEINAQARHMPENAQDAWSIGARTALADRASKFGAEMPTGDTAANLRKALGDEVKQQAIGKMGGNTGAVRGLQDRLEAEHQGNILWKEVQGNSRTANRQALDDQLNGEAGERALSSLSPKGMALSVVNYLANHASSQFRNDVKDRISRVVTETNPATVRELMAEIKARAAKDKDFADLLQKSGVVATKAYANNIEPVREDGQVLLDVDHNPSGSPIGLYGRPEDN